MPIQAEEDLPVPLPPGTKGDEYLQLLQEFLPRALDRDRPDLVVCHAGFDVLETDPLARRMLTADELAQRDLQVVTACRERGIPLARVLPGG
jgi:acetoin utilization deacetylase AcuC-like enzyme